MKHPGDDVPKHRKAHRHNGKGTFTPKQGRIRAPAAELEVELALGEVERNFGIRFAEPRDLYQGGTEEHIQLYEELMGL